MPAKFRSRLGRARINATVWSGSPGFVGAARRATAQISGALNGILEEVKGPITQAAMLDAIEPTLDKAKALTPKKTGALRESGYVEAGHFRGKPYVEIGFAKYGDPEYAVIIHESTEMYHKPPTRSKFLQAAVLGDLAAIRQRLYVAYKQAFNG